MVTNQEIRELIRSAENVPLPSLNADRFRFPVSLNLYVLLFVVLVISAIVSFFVIGISNTYKFLLISIFNLWTIGVFLAVLWMITVGIPRLISVIEQASLMPQRVNEYVFGEE